MRSFAITKPRRHAILDVGLPLHANTDSETDVAQLVVALLNEVAKFDRRTSHADILQALGIATAVRLAMADAAAKPGVDFSMQLLDVQVGAEDVDGAAQATPDACLAKSGIGPLRKRPRRTEH